MPQLTLGLDIGGTNIKAVLLDEAGRVRHRARWKTAAMGAGHGAILARLEDAIRGALARRGLADRDLAGIGLACAGLVRADAGRLERVPNFPHWEGLALGPWLAERFACPTALANDVNALAWGEWRLGAGRGTRHLVCLALGTGVGGGLVLDGRLYTGRDGLGAELGHLVVDARGRRCPCGNRGCLEAYAGARAITLAARRALARRRPGHRALAARLGGAEPGPAALDRAARAGDRLARALWDEAGRALGVAVASYVNIFAPDRIVIAGGVSRAGRLLLDPARAEARARLMDPAAQRLDLRLRALGDDGAAVGAALLARESRP
ncbi:MAG: ROK family protein [Candidatus Krumholzibacteriota bacterium]|nr:ROK family protein [Candidatus Krumholzibacteriota bacterium]